MSRTRSRPYAVAVAALLLFGRPAPAQEVRRFDMGFTPLAPAEAAADTRAFIRDNADLIAVPLAGGVPWTEAARHVGFHPYLYEDWTAKRSGRPDRGKLFLALSPGRGELADYRGEREGMPLPRKFRGKAFDDPEAGAAYLVYCREAVKFFKPDYLAIGIDVDQIRTNYGVERWRAYVKLHKHVYHELKSTHRDLPIFVTVSLHTS